MASSALVAGLMTLAPAAQGRDLSLNVTLSAEGTIAVTLPDGTPLGSTSGAPTVIPAGFYTVALSGPGGCAALPLFDLKGPGVGILSDMVSGEVTAQNYVVDFVPNSTYTWRNDRNPAAVYTFVTSGVVVGTAPAQAPHEISSGKQSTVSSQDLAGSAILPFRGTLAGAVSATGRLTLAYKGKSVTSLKAGRYTIAVTDKSSTNGFMLQKLKHAALSVTGVIFVGKHSAMVTITAGKWLVIPRLGKTTYSIVVS